MAAAIIILMPTRCGWQEEGSARIDLWRTTSGFAPVADRVHVHDMQATILRLLGLEHTKLTFRFQGRDFRLTDVEGKVVTELLA